MYLYIYSLIPVLASCVSFSECNSSIVGSLSLYSWDVSLILDGRYGDFVGRVTSVVLPKRNTFSILMYIFTFIYNTYMFNTYIYRIYTYMKYIFGYLQ